LWLRALWYVVFDLGVSAFDFAIALFDVMLAVFDFLEDGDLNLKEYSMRQLAP
jgi:hypothetical protein